MDGREIPAYLPDHGEPLPWAGPPGPPAAGYPPPPPQVTGPPPAVHPPPRSRGPLLLGLGAGAVALLAVCALLGVLLVTRDGPGSDPSSPERVAAESELTDAAQTLLRTRAVRYRGWATDDDGRRRTFDARVTSEGSTLVQFVKDGQRFETVILGGRTFVKAPAQFWTTSGLQAGLRAEFARRWVEVPENAPEATFGAILAPARMAVALAPWLLEQPAAEPAGTVTAGKPTTVNGVEVRRIRVAGVDVFVTTTAPRRIVRIRDDRINVVELAPRETEELFRALDQRIRELREAADAGVKLSVVGNAVLNPCSATRCRLTLKIKNTVPPGSPYLTVRRPVRFTVQIRMTVNRRPAKTCVESRSAGAYATVAVSCLATYRASGARRPVAATYLAMARAVDAADVQAMASALAGELKRNRALPRSATPVADGPGFLPGGTAPKLTAEQQQLRSRVEVLARQACREVRALPGEHPSLWSGRVHRRLAELVRAEQHPKLFSEVPYRSGGRPDTVRHPVLDRQVWPRGTVVADVVVGVTPLRPELIFDLKTGGAGLDPAWYAALQQQLPRAYRKVPAIAVGC